MCRLNHTTINFKYNLPVGVVSWILNGSCFLVGLAIAGMFRLGCLSIYDLFVRLSCHIGIYLLGVLRLGLVSSSL